MDVLLKIFDKFSSRPIFHVFGGLAIACLFNRNPLIDISVGNCFLFSITIILFATLFMFIEMGIEWFNSSLPSNDLSDIAPSIGTLALGYYIIIVFNFLSKKSAEVTMAIITTPDFVYTTTLLLFSLEMMKLNRRKLK